MVLLDLLHVQRAGFFKFLKIGINKELSQLNINVDNTRLQVIPFFDNLPADRVNRVNPLLSSETKVSTHDLMDSTNFLHSLGAYYAVNPSQKNGKQGRFIENKSIFRLKTPKVLKFPPTITLPPSLSCGKFSVIHTIPKKQTKGVKHALLVLDPKENKVLKRLSKKIHHIKAYGKQRLLCNLPDSRNYSKTNKPLTLNSSNKESSVITHPNQNSCFRLIASKYTPREAIIYQKSWSCKLVVKVLLTVHEKKESKRKNKTASVDSKFICKKLLTIKPVNPKDSKDLKDLKNLKDLRNSKDYLHPKSTRRDSINKGMLLNQRFIKTEANQPKSKQENQKRDHELFLVLGELPLMTKRGHFIIHGSPRVILSQLVRRPGIYFTQKNNELQADCVPEQGPWLCVYKNLSDGTDSKTKTVQAKPNASQERLSKQKETLLDYVKTNVEHSSSKDLSFGDSLFYSSYRNESSIQQEASYFCYTKQFSSMPFSLVYSTFRVFELHSQFTDQTLLLTKLKTLEKIRRFKEVITSLLTFTWKKRVRKRLQRLYTKRCFISTQQFEKTKLLFRLKNKLVLGPLSRKSFNEKLGMSSCINTGINHNSFNNDFFDTSFSINHIPKIEQNLSKAKESKIHLPATCCFTSNETLSPYSTCIGLQSNKRPMFMENSKIKGQFNNRVRTNHRSFTLANLWIQSKQSIRRKQSMHGQSKENNKQAQEQGLVIAETNYRSLGCMSYTQQRKLKDQIAISTQNKKNDLDLTQTNQTSYKSSLGNPWLNSTTLLSRDLALIARFLDSKKILSEDDIDDLDNQRIKTTSDQIQQQVRIGLFRFKKMFIKLISSGGTSQTITDFLNGALREFFGSNPLSQFLDQTNPLAEITHKRRVSKLGLNGIQRESATLKVRTIHSTYFGRICPIETPEGINAGLVNSLSCLSRVDQKGQLVTPLSILVEGQKQEQFFYYSNKEDLPLSTTDTALLKFHRLPNQFIYTKNESQFQQLEPNKVKVRVKSDLQTISLATSLIPFLAYDDANRALMGSNMQRQAVPLILPERPIIRTGMESLVINESGHSFESSSGGFISYVSAQHVVILCDTLNKRSLV